MVNRIPKPEEVVLFRKKRSPSFGVVREVLGDRVSLFSEEGKEFTVDIDRIVFSTGIGLGRGLTQSEEKLKLRGMRRELEEKRTSVDIKTLWECVSEEDRDWNFEELSRFYFGSGEPDVNDLLLFFWALEKEEVYFEKTDSRWYRTRKAQEVIETLLHREQGGKKELEKKMALRWARGVMKGDTKEFDVREPFDSAQDRPQSNDEEEEEFEFRNYIELLRGYAVYEDEFDRAKEARSFMSQVGMRSDPEGAAEFLIKLGVWQEDEEPLLKRFGIKNDFSKRVQEEAKGLVKGGYEYEKEGREDFTSFETYSIDDEGTEDIDDAISVWETPEGITVGIHIADVAGIVPKGSFIDEEASKRGETIYLPEGRVDMLPTRLVKEKLSLFEGEKRLALSLIVTFDDDFNIKNYKFTKSKVVVKRNVSYGEAEEFLRGTAIGSKLFKIASSLRKKRIERGAFLLELPELKVRVTKDEGIKVEKVYMNTIGHIVVAEFMILMNWLTGRFLAGNRIPAIYRSQLEPISENARELDKSSLLYPLDAIKFLKPSSIGVIPEPHIPLGVEVYVQITSPIRRYLDLIMQRQISDWIEKREFAYSTDELRGIYPAVELTIKDKKMVERSRRRYWLFKYLKGFEGKALRGFVTSLREAGALVYLPEYLLEVPVPFSSEVAFKEGREIELIVERVDPLRRRIVLIPREKDTKSGVQVT